ncbi:MAG: hypothetical protein MHMPM18_004959 [Marteilia pararefringens]
MSGKTLAISILTAAACFCLASCCEICSNIFHTSINRRIRESCRQSKDFTSKCFFDYWPNAPFQLGDHLKLKDEYRDKYGASQTRYYDNNNRRSKLRRMGKKRRDKYRKDYAFQLVNMEKIFHSRLPSNTILQSIPQIWR